jgi:hypothetical protein
MDEEHGIIKPNDCNWYDNFLPYDETVEVGDSSIKIEGTEFSLQDVYKAYILKGKIIGVVTQDSKNKVQREYSVKLLNAFSGSWRIWGGRQGLLKKLRNFSKSKNPQEREFYQKIKSYSIGHWSDIERYQPYAMIYFIPATVVGKRIEVRQNLWKIPYKYTIQVFEGESDEPNLVGANNVHELSEKLTKLAGYKIHII